MNWNKKKTIYTLLGLFGVQIILLIFLNVFSSQKVKSRTLEKKLIKELKKDDIKSFVINDVQDTFSVELKENKWFVNFDNHTVPGNSVKIEKYLDEIDKLPSGIVVNKGTETDIDKVYGFDKESYQKLTVKTDNKEYNIIIGNTGKEQGTSYIRYNTEKKIRHVKSAIASTTSNKATDWAKKNIFDDLDRDDVELCEITSRMPWFEGKYVIKYMAGSDNSDDKKEGEFVLVEPKITEELQDYMLGNIVHYITDLRADDYKFDEIGNDEKMASIKLTLKNSKVFNMDIYKADENDNGDYIVDVDFNNYLYLIEENDVKRFIKPIDEIIKQK